MKIMKQTLIDRKVIQENKIHDFSRWFCAICSGKNTFKDFSMESLSLKDSIRRVQDEVINVIEALFTKRLNEDGVMVNSLKSQLHEFFFVGSFSKEHFQNVSSFSNTMKKAQEMIVEWKNCFFRSEEEITLMEFDIESVPSVSVGELEVVIGKFIAYAINERDKGRPFLDEKLLTE